MSTDHLEEGDLQALLDGELPQAQAADALRHIGSCRSCGEVYDHLREASAALSAALGLLNDSRPAYRPAPVPPSINRRASWGSIPLGKAATLLILFGAAASATIPGSPLRDWLAARTDQPVTVAIEERSTESPEAATLALEPPRQSGAAAGLDLGRLRIVLTAPEHGLPVTALLTEDVMGGAYILGDSATGQFTGATGRVDVVGASRGQLRIEIPRSATTATVEIDGRVYLVKEGDLLRLTVPSSQVSGTTLEFSIE